MESVIPEGYTREQAKDSVGNGWRNCVDILFDAKPEETVVAQVKEKFGGLRFYVYNSTREYSALIRLIEGICSYLCEDCGKLGETSRIRGWIKNTCPSCKEKIEGINIPD